MHHSLTQQPRLAGPWLYRAAGLGWLLPSPPLPLEGPGLGLAPYDNERVTPLTKPALGSVLGGLPPTPDSAMILQESETRHMPRWFTQGLRASEPSALHLADFCTSRLTWPREAMCGRTCILPTHTHCDTCSTAFPPSTKEIATSGQKELEAVPTGCWGH